MARFRSRRRDRRPLMIGAVAGGAVFLLASALLMRKRLQPASAPATSS
ncbi:MAG TPA: hypothetical protein VFD49_14695 [Candidatus Dormibacteraeota bacterium]|nr:hypothetical protein [Candidatus Dormibacteraeota bacterium]